MLQSESWIRQGLATTPLSHCSKYAYLAGYLTRYCVLGSPDAPPLILVPGLAGGMDLCLPLASRLSQQFSVYVVQPRGEDLPSDLSSQVTLEELGADLVEFQKAVGLERPLIYGHGFGAVLSLEAARQCPGRFAGAVVQGIAPSFTSILSAWLLKQTLKSVTTSESTLQSLISPMFGARWLLPQLKQMALDLSSRTDLGVFTRRLQLMSHFDIEPLIDGLRQVPLLIQTATHDVFVSPEAWKPWRRVLPRMTLQTIDNAGHFAYLTHSEALASQIERFANRRLGVPLQLPAL